MQSTGGFPDSGRIEDLCGRHQLIPKTLQYEIKRTRTGAGYRSVEAWTGTGAKKLAASVFPAQAFNQKVTYQASDDSLYVSSDGTVTVNTTASWIQELDRQYLKSGSHTAYVTVKTEDGGFTDRAQSQFSMRQSIRHTAEVPIRAAAQVEALLLERGQRQEAVQRMQLDRHRGSVI